jgi:hypothetical protein
MSFSSIAEALRPHAIGTPEGSRRPSPGRGTMRLTMDTADRQRDAQGNEALLEHPLLRGLTASDLRRLAPHLIREEQARGAYVFRGIRRPRPASRSRCSRVGRSASSTSTSSLARMDMAGRASRSPATSRTSRTAPRCRCSGASGHLVVCSASSCWRHKKGDVPFPSLTRG